MSSAGSTGVEDGGSRRILGIWAVPTTALVALWLWLAFSSGGYIAHQWLPPSLALGLFAIVISLLVAYPRRPRQLSLAALGFFSCYAIWVAASSVWADSTTRVWMESARTFTYLLVFALALVYFTDVAARRALRYLVMLAALILLVACVAKLWSTDAIAGLFIEDRLSYPVSYPNNAGALFLVSFWPLMWLASGPEERAPVRGVALGLATGLLGLAIMTQSRGAIWSLVISLVFMFLISPARIRLLLYMLVPSLLMVYGFPSLNRYWLEGPAAVGGGPGARTLVMASVTAAFIGMIVALLERWVKVSRRMKAIFGAIVLLGALAGGIYGTITLTSDAGGPFKWVSQTWHQFTGQTRQESPTEGESRFTLVSSSGRVDIWKVAWQGFIAEPLRGVGADNFVFQYDRLRTRQTAKPQQAHSLGLQVLGETGAVGGVFAFGGILLTLGGLLWPRCTAGWRGARLTWLRRRAKTDASDPTDGAAPNVSSPPAGSLDRWCNPRWGNDPSIYGWEMALLAGATYWFIHANVDWLWQMAGVSIPALLFVAAAVASVDGRVDILWPRVARWLEMKTPVTPAEAPQQERVGLGAKPPDREPSATDGLMLAPRRGEQYTAKARRRARRAARKVDSLKRLQPPGLLSHVFRALLVTLSLLVLVVAGLPYLSIELRNSATALAKTDALRAVKRANSARWLLPSDPGPYLTQASIYTGAARRALKSDSPDRAGAVLDDLALAIASHEKATAVEPADWNCRLKAGVAAANLLLAKGYIEGQLSGLDYDEAALGLTGLQDWSALASLDQDVPVPGAATGSLAQDEAGRSDASHYRGLRAEALASLALDFLHEAEERNPLAEQVKIGLEMVEKVKLMIDSHQRLRGLASQVATR